ncbi:MAG: undecaprenyldiphospho-muramoylpentapeptide beta-N-acetylglucosaminyltransferase [Calditrichia bacterium]
MTGEYRKIVIAGGGTGGHVYPALATIDALQAENGFEFLYIGGYRGMENQIVPRTGLPFQRIVVSGWYRFLTWKNVLFPFKLILALIQSREILRKFKPAVVVGSGGYVSGPVVYMASKMGIPTLIEEQDSFPGLTTRLLAKYADVVCVATEHTRRFLPKVKGQLVVTGNPVRISLKRIDRSEAIRHWGLNPERKVVFIFGGSQGAQSINQAILEIAEHLISRYDVQFLWQTGSKNYQKLTQHPVTRLPEVKVLPYIERMDLAYSASDVVISRAGAMALAELAWAALPSILVPYPSAAGGHQLENARRVVEAGAALLVHEGDRFSLRLSEAIGSLLEDWQWAKVMSENWKKFHRPDASRTIAQKIIELIERKYHDKIRKS